MVGKCEQWGGKKERGDLLLEKIEKGYSVKMSELREKAKSGRTMSDLQAISILGR